MKVSVPPSPTSGESMASVGVGSPSAMVPVPVAVARVAFTGEDSVTAIVSSASSRPSRVTATATVFTVCPAANVSLPEAGAV